MFFNTIFDGYTNQVHFKSFSLDYKYEYFIPEHYRVMNECYDGYDGRIKQGTKLEKIEAEPKINNPNLEIEILKLHGSLNFPNNKVQKDKEQLSITKAISDPYILPPVSNKHSNEAGKDSWRIALNRLREAKSVVFVGYSLQKTDMYMQFFSKQHLDQTKNLIRFLYLIQFCGLIMNNPLACKADSKNVFPSNYVQG